MTMINDNDRTNPFNKSNDSKKYMNEQEIGKIITLLPKCVIIKAL